MKSIIIFICFFLAGELLTAAVPDRLNYQAVVHNAANQLMINQPVQVDVSILKDSVNGEVVYTENQQTTTDANGLITISIGNNAGFSSIGWEKSIWFLKTTIQADGNSITGVSQLLSVPYAFHAKSATALTTPVITNKQQTVLSQLVTDSISNPLNNVYRGGLVSFVQSSNYFGKSILTLDIPSEISLYADVAYIDTLVESNGAITTSLEETLTFRFYKTFDSTRKPYDKSYKIQVDILKGSTLFSSFSVSPDNPVYHYSGTHEVILRLVSESCISLTMDQCEMAMVTQDDALSYNSVTVGDISASKSQWVNSAGQTITDTSGLRTIAGFDISNDKNLLISNLICITNCSRKLRITPPKVVQLHPSSTKKVDMDLFLDESEKDYFGPITVEFSCINARGTILNVQSVTFYRVP